MFFLHGRKCFGFRFHLTRVLFIAFLLISPTQATGTQQSSVQKGCVEVASTWMKSSNKGVLLQDPKFVTNLLECFKALHKLFQETDWKTVEATITKEVKNLIQNVPNLATNAKDVAFGGGLVVLSAYLLYKSTELYARAEDLAQNFKKHENDFQALQEELTPIRALIDEEILPQWKNHNTAKMVKSIETLITKLNRNANVLSVLVDRIVQDVKQGSDNRIWSVSYGIAAGVVCAGSLFTGHPVVYVMACGFGGSAIAFCFMSYSSVSETLEKLQLLKTDTAKIRIEITKYRATLEVKRMKIEMQD